MDKSKSLIVVFLLFCGIAFGQETTSFSLEDAKSYALENHLTIKNADQDVEIARQKVVETRGMGLPQVDINGQFNHFLNIPVSVIDASFFNPMAPPGELVAFQMGTEYSATGTLQASQLVFNGSYIIGLKAANFFASFQESLSTQSKEDVVFNVIQSYELAAVAKQNAVFMDSLVASTQKLVDNQQHYADLGLILKEDMDQISYSLLSAKSAQLSAQLQYENALNMLKLSMGYPMADQIDIKNSPEELMSKESLSNGDVRNNLTFQILEKQVKLSEYNLKNNQFANLPSLNAFFQHSYNAYRNEFDFFANEKWFPQTVWGLQLNVPIFSGLSRHARTSQAKIRLMKDQNSLSQMEQSLQFQEMQIRNQLKTAKNNLQLQEQNSELAASIFNNEVLKKEIGKGNSLQVTQKHNQLIMAQAQYVGAMIDLFQAQLELDKLYNNILPNK